MKTILEEALEITSADREDQYGPVEESFARIAEYWQVYLRPRMTPEAIEFNPITAKDVAPLMILFKGAREEYKHKRDNLVDVAGYARGKSILEGDEEEVKEVKENCVHDILWGNEDSFAKGQGRCVLCYQHFYKKKSPPLTDFTCLQGVGETNEDYNKRMEDLK